MNIVLYLPKESRAFIISKFRSQEIQKVDKKTNRLWIEILNTSYFERLKIKNKTPLGFLAIEPENLKVEYYEAKKGQNSRRVYLRTGARRVQGLLTKKEDGNDKQEAFSTDMTLPMLAETQLIKLEKLCQQ